MINLNILVFQPVKNITKLIIRRYTYFPYRYFRFKIYRILNSKIHQIKLKCSNVLNNLKDVLFSGRIMVVTFEIIIKLIILLKKFLIWLVYDFSGIRFVIEKFVPPKDNVNKREPSTLLIWILGIYIAFWGLSTQIYESKNSKIQTRLSSAMIGLESNSENKNYGTLISCQSMESPIEPDVLKPWTSFISLFGFEDYDYDVVEDVKDFIETKYANLSNANLSDAKLSEADLSNANLGYADLSNANLSVADLSNADLSNADLGYSYLNKANLSNANLSNVNLSNAHLWKVDLSNANLSEVNLNFVYLDNVELSDEQIKQIRTFGGVKFGDNIKLLNRIKEIAPEKLIAYLEYEILSGVDLSGAYLEGVNLSYEQIKQVKTFYKADFGDNDDLLNKIKEISSEKLEKPD